MPLLPSIAAAETHGAVVPIGFQTVSGSSTSAITFSNIPQGFQDLFLVVNSRSLYATVNAGFSMQIGNGSVDAGSNYSNTCLKGDGSSATSTRSTASTITLEEGVPGANATSGVFGTVENHFLNYANTSTYKTILSRSAMDLNGSGTTRLTANLWRSTSAINIISCYTSGNWASNSTFALYGIRSIGQ